MDPIGFQDRVDQTWVQGAHPEVLPEVQAHGDVDEEGEEEVLCSTSFKQYFIQHFVLSYFYPKACHKNGYDSTHPVKLFRLISLVH